MCPTGDDVGVRERDQGRAGVGGVGRARQDGPERPNVLLHGLRRVRPEALAHRPGQLELLRDEVPQVELRRAARRGVAGDDLRRREPRSGVCERFRVLENPRELDVVKQPTQVARRLVPSRRLGEVGGGLGGCAGRRGARRQDREEQPPPTSPTSPNLPQPCRSHLNTIHSTPIVAASTTQSTMRSEEHTSELQSQSNLVCRLLLEKKKKIKEKK